MALDRFSPAGKVNAATYPRFGSELREGLCGGPLMLFLAAAWIGFVVWVAETLRKLKDIALLMGQFLQSGR